MIGCADNVKENMVKPIGETITLNTADGFKIIGSFIPAMDTTISNPKVALLIHMLNRDRSDWNNFASELSKHNYNVLAIDMRGHGGSLEKNGLKIGWRDFKINDFAGFISDIDAAKKYLDNKYQGLEYKLAIIGASVGANAALNYSVAHQEVKCVVLLSPGANYHGISTENIMDKYGDRPIFLAASGEDAYSMESVKSLYDKATGKREKKEYYEAGHGTRILETGVNLKSDIISWLDQNI